MQLFQVKAPDGALIMNAPMETIARVWYLTPATIAQILRTTARLDAEHVLSTARARWPATLHIQRLPLEIPARGVPEARVPTARCVDEGCPHYGIPHVHTTETTLGKLLCDE